MKRFGAMIDMSRNAVMKPSEVKKYARTLKDFGYNMLQLYTEDTYEVENEPYFGYLRGKYTVDELKDIVDYCEGIGMEVIPCIQTLAHLSTIFLWKDYKCIQDIDDILIAGEDRTYQLIENMFITLRKVFKSEYIHIGMDEAHNLGLGKYLDKNGYHNRFNILHNHLEKVIEISKKHGFKPIMWSDMFFRLANHGVYYANPEMITEEVTNACPDGVELVYWDYYRDSADHYRDMMASHKKFKGETWFAGGAWCWKGFAPDNKATLDCMSKAMQVCTEQGVENIFITMWGDNGRECSPNTVLPSLYAIKRLYDGVSDMEQIKSEFAKITGESFDAIVSLDEADYVGDHYRTSYNPSKHMLYSDPFFGYLDKTVAVGGGKIYGDLAKKYKAYAKESASFGYVFESYAMLCEVMAVKYELGVNTRTAYASKNKAEIKAVYESYLALLPKIDAFHSAFSKLWHKENKPNGFEVQDIRIGGLRQRLLSCAQRLSDYITGEIDSIPELEEELLEIDRTIELPHMMNNWLSLVSVNRINW